MRDPRSFLDTVMRSVQRLLKSDTRNRIWNLCKLLGREGGGGGGGGVKTFQAI